MNRLCRATVYLLTLLAVAIPSWAKGDMVLIEIMGGSLPSTIKITDPNINQFNIWAGAMANDAGLEQAEGFIINWKAGAVPKPQTEIEHYQVAFYAGCNSMPKDPMCRAEKPRLKYVVQYGYDGKSKQGFVYLPGFNETWGHLNGGSIYRGNSIDGHWFRASDAWLRFVQPILDKDPWRY
jgi:hypothetical protein